MALNSNWFPVGSGISDEVFAKRHRFLLWVLLAHVPVLTVIAFFTQWDLHLMWEIGLLLLAAWAGSRPFLSRTTRAAIVSVGLLTSAALLVHVTGGLIEAHFHFFVLLPVVALYQDWRPLASATVFVAAHHAVLGIVSPDLVFNPAIEMHPLVRTGLHALFVVVEVTLLAFRWRFDQEVLDAQAEAQVAMQEVEKARAADAEDAAAEAEEKLAQLSELQAEQEETARKAAAHAEQLADEMERSRLIQGELLQIAQELLAASTRTGGDVTAITDGARAVSDATSSTVEVARAAAASAEQGEESIRSAALAIEQALIRLTEAEREAQTLTEHAKQIDTIVSLVTGIAEQTNLLALNAAIEAARAGEQGRGFSVVASEVKTLAESTSESLQGISELVRSTDSGVNALVRALSDVEAAVSQSSTTSLEAESHFAAIAGRVREIADRIAGMSERVAAFEDATSEIARSAGRLGELAETASRLATTAD